MTELTIIETGEVIHTMNRVEAERATARIVDKLDGIADNYEQVMPLIREALTRQAHAALGYPSITAYVSERFESALTRLPRQLRVPVVAELSAAGMSTRAIANITGTSHMQAARDRAVTNVTAEPTPQPAGIPASVFGRDGKTYPRSTPRPATRPDTSQSIARREPDHVPSARVDRATGEIVDDDRYASGWATPSQFHDDEDDQD